MNFYRLLINKKKCLRSLREAGASLVEMGLLIALIALIAIPAFNEVGWKSTCKMVTAAGLIEMAKMGGSEPPLIFGKCSWPSGTFFDSVDSFAGICDLSASDPVVQILMEDCL